MLPLKRKLVQTTLVLWLITILGGCGTLAKVGTTGATAAVGAVVAGPAGAVTGAILGDVVGEVLLDPLIKWKDKKEMVEEKVDSVWSLLAKLGEVAGWIIGAALIIPLVLGYLIPSPKIRRKIKRVEEDVD